MTKDPLINKSVKTTRSILKGRGANDYIHDEAAEEFNYLVNPQHLRIAECKVVEVKELSAFRQ